MADFASRNRPVSIPVALVLCSFLLFLLAGCAATPSGAPSQFASFATATTSFAQDVQKLYLLSKTEQEFQAAYRISDATTKDKTFKFNILKEYYGFSGKPNFMLVPMENMTSRITYLQYLVIYSTSLKNIMASTSITELGTNINKFGAALDAINANDLTKNILPATGISHTEIASAAVKALTYTLEKSRNAAVIKIINDMQPKIRQVIDDMKQELGSCASGKTEASGHIATSIEDYYTASLTAAQEKARKKLTTNNEEERITTIQTLLQGRSKFELTCGAIALTNATLDAYATLHASLPDAFNQDSKHLTDNLTNMTLHLQVLEAALTALNTKEKQ
jgi:hypothetical protein